MKVSSLLISLFLFVSVSLSQNNSIIIHALYTANNKCNTDSGITKLTYHIREDLVRLDIKSKYANSSIVYQPATEKLWVLFHFETSFYSMDERSMRTLDQQVQNTSDRLMEKYNEMSEEDKQTRETMWGGGSPFDFQEPVFERMKGQDSLISQMICTKHKAVQGGSSTKYMYTNSLKSLKISKKELENLMSFSEFMGKGVKALSGNMAFTSIRYLDDGLPILYENYTHDLLCSTLWVTQIYRYNLDDDFFKIPISYVKIENPLGYK